MNATPIVKIILNKGKQIWKPKGKLYDNSLKKTKRVWKATGKLFANVGYQWRPTGKKFSLGKLHSVINESHSEISLPLGEQCPLTKLPVKCCSKHMMGNRSKLKNFIEKFIGTVRFKNDHFGAIMGYGDYVYGDNLKFFQMHSCFVRDMNDVDLLKGSRSTNLYMISIDDMMKSSPIIFAHCQLWKKNPTKHKYSHKPKTENTNMEVLHTLHMDLCGPIRVQSINGKKYILVIVDDYSRFTWVKLLRSKDKTLEFVINFLKQIQVGLNKTVRYIRTDNGTEFVNQVVTPSNLSMQRNVEYPKALHYWVNSTRSDNDY
ncbi:integrase, catalytic region, zinc finger, CCHC-type containing protein [Tanacetum coccineum]